MSAGLKRVLIVTGSGISAGSGIPTFRGKEGYWRNLDPAKLATAAAFENDPKMIWEWYRERRELIRRSQPNAAHQALVRLAAQTPDFLLLTQNVDDLHARAEWEGHRLAAERMVQIHGDIFVARCRRCDFRRREPEKDLGDVPMCPKCGSPLRPGVIWFDEELEADEVKRVEQFLAGGNCDAVLVIGTTAVFDYIVNWARAGRGRDGRLIEVNPEATPVSQFADEVIRSTADVALPGLVSRLIEK